MTELLEIYDLKGKLIGVKDKKKFYSEVETEIAKTGKISKKLKSIRAILLNSKGRIYIQKRSKFKEVNPGLYDKTIGAHVRKGDSWDITLTRECAEELGFPATVVPENEFEKTIRSTDLTVVGIFKKIDYVPDFKSLRIDRNSKKVVQHWITTIYIGYFDGSIRFVDGESSGIEVFTLDELNEEINKYPNRFTEDVKFIIKKYKKFIKPIKKF